MVAPSSAFRIDSPAQARMLASRMSPADAPRVWITRAEPGASATARRVEAAGLVPLVTPLLETADLADASPALDALPPSAVLAFTSANGVRAFARLTPRRVLKVWCVGAATAGAARQAGFVDVTLRKDMAGRDRAGAAVPRATGRGAAIADRAAAALAAPAAPARVEAAAAAGRVRHRRSREPCCRPCCQSRNW
jgi:uroporphyrinogen-III synthase